jgi:hypothetical protein
MTTAPSPGVVPPTATPSSTSPPPQVSAGSDGELNVTVADGQGTILVDGREVGQGNFRGPLAPGRHQVRVTRDGYEPYDSSVEIGSGEVRSESVALRPSVAPVEFQSTGPIRDEHGIYGGLQILGALQPSGAGTTLEDSCGTTGATSCSAGTELAAGLLGYVGWLFDPLGLELALLASADLVQPSASFDGEHGSEINPILASPAREEKFKIARFGGGAAIRGRVSYSLPKVRFTFAAGPGFTYRYFAFRRTTDAADGFSGETAEAGPDYVSPMLSLEAAAQWRVSKSFALAAGVVSWFEHAGDDTVSESRNDTFLTGGDDDRPVAQATPEYHLANGPQWYLGPFLGVAFGP